MCDNIGPLIDALKETRTSFMTLTDHCTEALRLLGKTTNFINCQFGLCVVYTSWDKQYKVSLYVQSEYAILQLALAVLIIYYDCFGQLVYTLNDEQFEDLYYKNIPEIKQIIEVL